jgi:hypothetical protein
MKILNNDGRGDAGKQGKPDRGADRDRTDDLLLAKPALSS